MKALFWICLGLITYAYVGYALLLFGLARLRKRPVEKDAITPSVSILIAARNEEKNLSAKLENLYRLDYPQDRIQIVVASDGSTDGTVSLLRQHASRVTVVELEESGGKATALNRAVECATGEVFVFLDARQSVDARAIAELTACFADPSVGAASGELLIEAAEGSTAPDSIGIYWKIEKALRKLESATGSVVGVTGAIYAIRRELYTKIPPGTILDDVYVPMHVAALGKRVVFEPLAIARDRVFTEKGKEFSRKVRTLTGNYQLLMLAPWLLSSRNPILFRFISHKLLRLLVPLLLVLLLIASMTARGSLYSAASWIQLVFYLLAVLGFVLPFTRNVKPVAIANTFVMLNAAAALSFYNFVSGRKDVWV